ncbi:MAG: hypothetical protein ACW981_20490 [Candidatus Hodarchaeales archaeon]|jgi:predicted transcriptional regulator
MESIIKHNSILSNVLGLLKETSLISESHLLVTLYFFHAYTQGGRYALSDFLNFNESKTRYIMNKLIDSKIITSSKGRLGSIITDLGKELCEELFDHYKILNYDKNLELGLLSVGEINGLIALPINNFEFEIDVLKIRDSIIRNGTIGASIFKLIINKSNFNLSFSQVVKDEPKLDKNYQKAFKDLISKIKPFFPSDGTEKSWLLVAGTNSYEKTSGNRRLSKKSVLRKTIIATLQGLIDCNL